MKICKNCKSTISNKNKYCEVCGNKINDKIISLFFNLFNLAMTIGIILIIILFIYARKGR